MRQAVCVDRWAVARPWVVGSTAAVVAVLGVCGLSGCVDRPQSASQTAGPSTTYRSEAPAPTGVVATGPGWHAPPANAVFDYQIGGAYPPATAVGVVDRDRTAAPVPGRYNICYVNAFQTQSADNPWWEAHHDPLLLKDADGLYVEDPNWPGERLLDISTPALRTELAAIVGGWFGDCAAHGYQAVEPDNLDSWTRSGGLLSQSDTVAFARLLAQTAHGHGLAIGQKNTPELGHAGRTEIGFDFAIAEECAVYDECDQYLTTYGDEVYEIEYIDNGADAYRRACTDRGARISIILRDRGVAAPGNAGYHNEHC